MKKQLMLLLLFACSLVAKAQFANPFKYDNGKGISYEARVFVLTHDQKLLAVPQDTIVDENVLAFEVEGKLKGEEYPGKEEIISYRFNGQVKDYYKRDMSPLIRDFGVTLEFRNMGSGEETLKPSNMSSTELGGHFYWEWKDSIEGFGQKGHIQMNLKPFSKVYGKNGDVEVCNEYSQLDIYSKIRTGFPYDIANYQGVTKYSVYDPDSTLICTKEIPLRMSADSTMNGQIQEDLICTVDSARKGTYKVVMEAPFLEKPIIWPIEVVDPLANASSKEPANATYRLKEPDFKNEGKGKGWKRSGNIKPTYFNGEVDKKDCSAMVVRAQGYEGNGFSLSQTIEKMPQGYYTLSWPVIYQPCDLKKMEGKEPVLAQIEANGFSANAKHILAGAEVTDPKSGEEGMVALVVPQSDKAFALRLKNAKYQNEITFQVMEDSVINIGMHKSHGTLDNEITAIGCPTLNYYGAGLPYGTVTFPKDLTFAAGDSIKMTVGLYDGIGKKVSEDNIIEVHLLKQKEDGNFDKEEPVISIEVKAPKSGSYEPFIQLPEGESKLPDGNYCIAVLSLVENDICQLYEANGVVIKTASAINEVIAEPTANTAKGNADKNTYNLAGMKVSNSNQAKGIYIKGKKKVARR